MKILEIKTLAIPDINVIKFERFHDHRGYFTEQFRKSDLNKSGIKSLENIEFVQGNEGYSKEGVIRGFHFQWDPYMGKLVRTISGHMIDFGLDIRKGSPTYGKIVGYSMPSSSEKTYNEWIWIPPGFAHGFLFTKDSTVEYLCSGEHNPKCESGISPLAKDIDWSLCDKEIKEIFNEKMSGKVLISEKDVKAPSLKEWEKDERSNNFIYSYLKEKGI